MSKGKKKLIRNIKRLLGKDKDKSSNDDDNDDDDDDDDVNGYKN